MGNKPGRNQPCPCGSGKKYKKCCIGKPIPKVEPMSAFEMLINSYDQFDLLKINAALQLLPVNHGKNIRFEIFAREVLSQSHTKSNKITFSQLTTFYENNFQSHYMEDPVSSFFTENVIWYFGDFTVFPGLNDYGTRILNFFLESIFAQENDLPEDFKTEVRNGVMMVLAMSESMAMAAGLKRYEYEESPDSRVNMPSENRLTHLKDAVSFGRDHLEQIASFYEVSIDTLNYFVIDINDPALQSDDPDTNPLLIRPIVKNGGNEFIFSLPTTTVHCLTQFIKNQALEKKCWKELMQQFNRHQWNETKKLLRETSWEETDIELPKSDLAIKESVFRFDNDKLAYVNFIMGDEVQEEPETADNGTESSVDNPYDTRSKEVIQFLKKLNGDEPYRYFVLNIIGQSSQDFYFLYRQAEGASQSLSLKFGELEKLVFAGDLDKLTLWKFAKVYKHTHNQTRIFSMGGILDAFVNYQLNNESLLPSDAPTPDLLNFVVGDSSEFERAALLKKDEHSALSYTGNYGLLPVPVRRVRDFAPIYKEREFSRNNNLLIECFRCPVWVKNDQARSPQDKERINHINEAIVFWLYKMRSELHKFFHPFGSTNPVEFQLILEQELISSNELPKDNTDLPKLDFEIKIDESTNSIALKVPKEISAYFLRADNLGEKELMKAILKGFSELLEWKFMTLNEETISELINTILSPDSAKMILYFDTTNEPRLDSRWLVPYRSIQDSEVSLILDGLVDGLNLKKPIPEKVESKEEKKDLCNKIVASLVGKLLAELSKYDSGELLKWLMAIHERCIQKREYRELHIPAKIACFSDFPTEVEKLEKESRDLVATALSTRCVIEFIAAKPSFGNKWPNIDDYDQLIALMNQIINWGMLSDTIDLGMDDPEMGLLPSGRIGTDKTFAETMMKSFSMAKAETTVYNFETDFQKKISDLTERKPEDKDPSDENVLIDNAFKAEWGIGLTDLTKIKGALVAIAFAQEKSVVEMEEGLLHRELSEKLSDMDKDSLKAGLELITLSERDSVAKSPEGYDKNDIYPWKYNRSLSYLRKPLVRINKPDGQIVCYWSLRHVLDSSENLNVLLFTGRLKTKKGGLLAAYVKKINEDKGYEFREDVFRWLTEEGSLEVIPYEVSPKKLSGKEEDGKYGDVDVLAIDHSEKKIYSIECKNTVSARVIHEMKTEMDKYLGRTEDTSWVHKHVKRDGWLKENIELLKKFTAKPEEYKIVSLMLTSEDVPTAYLALEELPLPIVSFPALKRKGSLQKFDF